MKKKRQGMKIIYVINFNNSLLRNSNSNNGRLKNFRFWKITLYIPMATAAVACRPCDAMPGRRQRRRVEDIREALEQRI